jgi:FkbM family methyltransferase
MIVRGIARALRRLLRLVPQDAVIRILSGHLFWARWIVGSHTHGCWLGTYEKSNQRIFRSNIKRGDVVWDIGANDGFFSLIASRLVGASGCVCAYEPLPRNVAILRRHVALNHAGNVHVSALAISSSPGSARFRAGAHPAMGSLADGGEIEVATDTVDGLIDRCGMPPPNFIKMDIEGGEVEALRGADRCLRTYRPIILLAAHGAARYDECLSILTGHGYRCETVYQNQQAGDYAVLAR